MNINAQFVAIDPKVAGSDELTGNQKAILLAIQAFLPNPYPSIAKIMECTGLCRNTVFRHLKVLEKKNILKRINRWGTSNLYRINPALLLNRVYKEAEKRIKYMKNIWDIRLGRKNGTPPVSPLSTLTKSKELYKEEPHFFDLGSGAKTILQGLQGTTS